MSAPVVIVGTGLAGYNLARDFRKLDSETPLLLITADDGRSYSKPMLSTGFAKNKDADGLSMAEPGAMADAVGETAGDRTHMRRMRGIIREVREAEHDALAAATRQRHDEVAQHRAPFHHPGLGAAGRAQNRLMDRRAVVEMAEEGLGQGRKAPLGLSGSEADAVDIRVDEIIAFVGELQP